MDELVRCCGPFAVGLLRHLDPADIATLTCVGRAFRDAVASDRPRPAPCVVPFPPGAHVPVCPAHMRRFICDDDRANQHWWDYTSTRGGVLAVREGDHAVVWFNTCDAGWRRVEVSLKTPMEHGMHIENATDNVMVGLYDDGRNLGVFDWDVHGNALVRIYDVTTDECPLIGVRGGLTMCRMRCETTGDARAMIRADGTVYTPFLHDVDDDEFIDHVDAFGFGGDAVVVITTLPDAFDAHDHDHDHELDHDHVQAPPNGDLTSVFAYLAVHHPRETQTRKFAISVGGLPWIAGGGVITWTVTEDEVAPHSSSSRAKTSALQVAVSVDHAAGCAVVRAAFARDGQWVSDRPQLTLATWWLRANAPVPAAFPPDAMRVLVPWVSTQTGYVNDYVTVKSFTNVRLNANYVSFVRPVVRGRRQWVTELCVMRCDDEGGKDIVIRPRRAAEARVDLATRTVTVADPIARAFTVFSY